MVRTRIIIFYHKAREIQERRRRTIKNEKKGFAYGRGKKSE